MRVKEAEIELEDFLLLKEYLEQLLNVGLNSKDIDFFDHLPQIKQ
jgi:hypothetical protein